mmetsp:Transcript_63082/g.203357  ORF Transcript_63082/g.203357 Transcript_63082/m.203357 type:complete len:299 (-) Transcript_63082:2328-3224(-)
MWCHVDAPLHRVGVAQQHPQDSKLAADSLATGRWSADEAVVVRGIERAERLGLNGVEHLQALCRIELLCLWVAQCRKRQRLEVEQLCVRRVLLRQDKVPEGDGQQCLRVDPAIGDNADEVLRRQRLRDGHREIQRVLLLRAPLLQNKHLLVQDLLSIHILYKDPEGLRAAMHLSIPLEVGRDCQLHHEARACDGLHVRTEIQFWELMHQLVDGLAHLGEADEFTNFGARQVVVALPGEILLLNLPQDVLGQALEVPQGRLRAPHTLVDHLAPVECAQCQGSPAPSKADLEDGAHDAAR